MINQKISKAFPALAALVIFMVFSSCTSDTLEKNCVDVDFSKKTAVVLKEGVKKEENVLRVGVAAMMSPTNNLKYYSDLVNYISSRVNTRGLLVQRNSYAEMNEMIKLGGVDMAFICSGAFVDVETPLEIVAVPVINGKKTYNSLIITNTTSGIKTVRELKKRSFAFVDPLSNTGRLYPIFHLISNKYDPKNFFGRTIFTGSHDNSIEMVMNGLVDAAAVDSIVFDYYLKEHPSASSEIHILNVSPDFGIPPIVTRKDTPEWLVEKVRGVLLQMNSEPEGIFILRELHFDGFEIGDVKAYRTVREIYATLRKNGL